MRKNYNEKNGDTMLDENCEADSRKKKKITKKVVSPKA